MKTPKELLLQRHQAIEPKLNAVRQKALATLDRPSVAQSWREFVFSMRWHLAGVSAIWMAVLLLNLNSADGSPTTMARDKMPPAKVLFAALLENRRELLELTEMPPASEPAPLPPRRSERQTAFEMA
jgi:wyosine [tRNA(Phe)-imidazoG37] synthetase (radical SAM superfamily)